MFGFSGYQQNTMILGVPDLVRGSKNDPKMSHFWTPFWIAKSREFGIKMAKNMSKNGSKKGPKMTQK